MRYNILSILIFAGIFYDYKTCSPVPQEQHYRNNRTLYNGTNIWKSTEDISCKSNLCARKCCPEGNHYSIHLECTPSEHKVDLKIPQPTDITHDYKYSDFQTVHRSLFCPNMCTTALVPYDDHFEFYKNGTLNTTDFGQRGFSEFCFEYFERHNATTAVICYDNILTLMEVGYSKDYFKCKGTDYALEEPTTLKAYVVAFGSSIFFLVLTLIIHLLINQRHPQSMHSALLRCHILTIILQDSCILAALFVKAKARFACIFLGYLTQFSILSNFSWMNAMCIDLWLTLTKFRLSTSSRFSCQMFLMYCLYAVGIPAIITLTTLLEQFYDIFGNLLKPDVGSLHCHLTGRAEAFYFLHLFTAIMIIANIYLFGSTAFAIFNVNKKWENSGNSMEYTRRHICRQKQRKTFFLYLKLFLIMGLCWAMKLPLHLMENDYGISNYTAACYCFQGVLLFVTVICNRKVLIRLKEKVHLKRGFEHNTTPQRRNENTMC